MPNHITNRIKLIGEPAEVKRVMEAVKNDEVGLGSIDFEKIIPMPADVDDSYNWCISNWGTKWNSYGYESIENPDDSDNISFLTAWSAPHPVLEKLTAMFPSVTIEHEWADEDISYNCGRKVYYDGERIEEYYPEYGSKEAYEFAADVMDRQLEEDYSLYLNASETGYINIEYDDEYELIDLFDKPALFTNARITDEQFYKAQAAGISNAQLYKQAGNAVTVNVIEALANFIKEIDKEMNEHAESYYEQDKTDR